jgi:hypothetical protein
VKEFAMKRWIIVLLAAFAFTASAADITGNWKATADLGGQTIERTFTFKVEGAKLTGETTSQMAGKSVIENGKIEGDDITFTIKANIQGNEMTMNYKGKVSGSEIKFTVDAGGNNIEWVAKKVS